VKRKRRPIGNINYFTPPIIHQTTNACMSLTRKKSLDSLLAQAADSEKGLKRTLGAGNLIALGIGAIIGAGLFVRTAAAAGGHAGPAVTLSFIVAAVGCAFAGLCYAEFASIIPIAGSAYTYAYATMGELVAWIIGWALILEYALGAATVSIAWSEFLNKLTGGSIPYEWCPRIADINFTYPAADKGNTGIGHCEFSYRNSESIDCNCVYSHRLELYQARKSYALSYSCQCTRCLTGRWYLLFV
jgi:hypothetical protein